MENNSNDKIHIWSDSTKIIVGFAVLILFSFLFFRFVNFISPLMITAVLVYILHPLARRVTDKTKLKWTGAVNLVFFHNCHHLSWCHHYFWRNHHHPNPKYY